jgi:hypothetical protein
MLQPGSFIFPLNPFFVIFKNFTHFLSDLTYQVRRIIYLKYSL